MNTVADIARDSSIKELVKSHGLCVNEVCWEDTSRFSNSCFGNNITDMTLIAKDSNRRMPVIRRDNFVDVTCDLNMDKLSIYYKGETMQFKDYIQKLERQYSTKLLKDREDKILVSSQACILGHTAKNPETEFAVQMYNYQSEFDNPAVLVIVASSLGVSSQTLEKREELYFDNSGDAHYYIARRLEDDRKMRNVSTTGEMTSEEKARNVLYIYQIPLKKKVMKRDVGREYAKFKCGSKSASSALLSFACEEDGSCRFDMFETRGITNAMLDIGSFVKKFKKMPSNLIRDERYPIRLTLQYYYITDDAKLSHELMAKISNQLDTIYNFGENKGSLVVSKDERPTSTTKALPTFNTGISLSECI